MVIALGAALISFLTPSYKTKYEAYKLEQSSIMEEARAKLREAGISSDLINKRMPVDGLAAPLSFEEWAGLTDVESQTITDVREEWAKKTNALLVKRPVAASGASGLMGFALGLIGAVVALVTSLLGWLLTMTKKVLRCGSCGATVAAS